MFFPFRLQGEMVISFRSELEQSCITVQIMLNKDQCATTQTAHGDMFEWLVCSFFSDPINHTRDEAGLNHTLGSVRFWDYTTVQTVLSVVSNRTALVSVGFMLVSYIGFSNDAWPLELS